MEWSVEFEQDGAWVTVRLSGVPDLEGFGAYLARISSDPAWRAGLPILVDARELDTSKAPTELVLQLVDFHEGFVEEHGTNPVAIVVSRTVEFGMMRMWTAFSEGLYPPQDVFYTLDEAREWLRREGAR